MAAVNSILECLEAANAQTGIETPRSHGGHRDRQYRLEAANAQTGIETASTPQAASTHG